jgi:hypothetical protein
MVTDGYIDEDLHHLGPQRVRIYTLSSRKETKVIKIAVVALEK